MLIDYFSYLIKNKKLLLKFFLLFALVSLCICSFISPVYEKEIILRVPDNNGVEICTVLNAKGYRGGIQIKAMPIRNTHLISLKLKGQDKDGLEKYSEDYLKEVVTYLNDRNNKFMNDNEVEKLMLMIENRLNMIDSRGDSNEISKGIASLTAEIQDIKRDSVGQVIVEYNPVVSDSPAFPPTKFKIFFEGGLLGIFLGIIILSYRYIQLTAE